MLTTLAVENYRSLRRLVLPLRALTVVTGANGSGKSNLYRALNTLAEAARDGAVAAVAREGGLASALWAGPETTNRATREGRAPVQGTVRKQRVGVRLGFAGTEFGYAMDLGLPQVDPATTLFAHDPEIKREAVWAGPVLRPSALLADRHTVTARFRDDGGRWAEQVHSVRATDSILSAFADPRHTPELLTVRERIRSWRFYDQFRTDRDAPARAARIGTRTPVLGGDGGDLASALRTIQEIGDAAVLDAAVDRAFPGSSVKVVSHAGRFDVRFHQHGLLRPLAAAELSDGTLRYLLLVAVLLSPRPPELLVLNEPETSLHPELLAPLAELIGTAAERTQVVVVTHAVPLVRALDAVAETGTDVGMVKLVKEFGATVVEGQGRLDEPSWHWPKR